jgi:hypothetical protein
VTIHGKRGRRHAVAQLRWTQFPSRKEPSMTTALSLEEDGTLVNDWEFLITVATKA